MKGQLDARWAGWFLAFAAVCMSAAPQVSADRGGASALAFPYFTDSGETTAVTVVNEGSETRVLRLIAIDGDEASSYGAESGACLLPPLELSAIRIEPEGAGASRLTARCADPADPVQRIDVSVMLASSRGVLFVAQEDPTTGATLSGDDLFGEATIFDFARGTEASVEAVAIRAGGGANDGDRSYRFDGVEYEELPAANFDGFAATGPTPIGSVATSLVFFSPDGTTFGGNPAAGVEIVFFNELAVAFSARHSFEGFDAIALSEIDVRFEGPFLGSPTGTINLFGAAVLREDTHEGLVGIGNGDKVRRSAFWAWQLVDSTFVASNEGASVSTRAGRRLVDFPDPVLPTTDDAAPVLRYFEDPDGDGVETPVDAEPVVFSSSFDDGSTEGTIVDRGSQRLLISDVAAPQGVVIESVQGVVPFDALLEVCGATAQMVVSAGVQATLTCGSVILSVRAGLVTLLFSIGGEPASVEVGPGNEVTFDPEAGTLTAGPGNTNDIVVETPSGDFVLQPGEGLVLSVDISIEPKRLNLLGVGFPVRVTIRGSADLDVRDFDEESLAFGPAGATPYKIKEKDVDKDGFKDLTATFRLRDTGIMAGDLEACLTGEVAVAGSPTGFASCAPVRTRAGGCGLGAELGFLALLYPWLSRRRCR